MEYERKIEIHDNFKVDRAEIGGRIKYKTSPVVRWLRERNGSETLVLDIA